MTKKNPLFTRSLGTHWMFFPILHWHDVPKEEYRFYAHAFHKAARMLAANTNLDKKVHADWDACPVVSMYRHALELHLKSLVLGSGINFLSQKPDLEFVHRTNSLRRLLEIIFVIVEADDTREASLVDARPTLDVARFAAWMDRILDLLDGTGKALDGEWEKRSEAMKAKSKTADSSVQ